MYKNGTAHDSRGLVQLALFSAIIIAMAMVPFLGYIPLGFMRATIIHIPVILGSVLLGPRKGAVLGGVFGLTSLVNNTVAPNVTSFVFTPFYSLGDVHGNWASLLICLVPRILVGVLPYFVFIGLKRLLGSTPGKLTVSLGVAGFVGSMTNTLLVMNLIYLLFGQQYAQASGKVFSGFYQVILSVILVQGVPEALVATVLVLAAGKVLLQVLRR